MSAVSQSHTGSAVLRGRSGTVRRYDPGVAPARWTEDPAFRFSAAMPCRPGAFRMTQDKLRHWRRGRGGKPVRGLGRRKVQLLCPSSPSDRLTRWRRDAVKPVAGWPDNGLGGAVRAAKLGALFGREARNESRRVSDVSADFVNKRSADQRPSSGPGEGGERKKPSSTGATGRVCATTSVGSRN